METRKVNNDKLKECFYGLHDTVDGLKSAIKRFKEGQFTECPEQLSSMLWNLTTTI